MNEKLILTTAVTVYGINNQREQLNEEMAELVVALSKHRRGTGTLDHVAEEMADVRIMLEQLEYAYMLHSRVSNWREIKLKRLAERMNIYVEKE